MKLLVITLIISGVVCEAPGPYPPSGWRPNGPTLELPERTPVDPRNRPQKQEYLPPNNTPTQEYGPPEVDVSVQGLPPTQEQLPVFQLSPVNGQQYAGPAFNNDLRNLEQNQREAQLQAQQNIYREFARQRQLEAALANANRNNSPVPRQFVPQTTTTQKPDDFKTTPTETTTEALNQGEVENKDNKEKVSVEVSKQNIQEYRPELFLTPLAQLQLQNQYAAPVQLGQLRAPIYLEPAQKQVLDYNAAQLLAQQQYLQIQQQLIKAQLQAQPQAVQPVQSQLVQPVQSQLVQPQVQVQQPYPAYAVPEEYAQGQNQQPTQYQLQAQYQPNQYDVQPVQPVQTVSQVPQQVFLQPQPNQLLPNPQAQQTNEQGQQVQPQFVYQYQPEYPSQFQYQQPLTSYQADVQPQVFIQDPAYQQQIAQGSVQVPQGQGSLQSGFDVNQQDNGIDQAEEKDGDDEGNTATAVATAFGARTQPRVYTTYGAPVPVPRVQANPGYQTTEQDQDNTTDAAPTVAEATAVAGGDRRRPAKIRARQGRVRPIFTLDRSGHLVLAQDQ